MPVMSYGLAALVLTVILVYSCRPQQARQWLIFAGYVLLYGLMDSDDSLEVLAIFTLTYLLSTKLKNEIAKK